MNCLSIDKDRCTNCGNCDAILPGLLEKAVDGRLPISSNNVEKEESRINQAIEACDVNALTLEEM